MKTFWVFLFALLGVFGCVKKTASEPAKTCGRKIDLATGMKKTDDCPNTETIIDPCDCPNDCEKGYEKFCTNRIGDPIRKTCNVRFLYINHVRNRTDSQGNATADLNVYKPNIQWQNFREYFQDSWIFNITHKIDDMDSSVGTDWASLWNRAASGLTNSADGCSFGIVYMRNFYQGGAPGLARVADRKVAYANTYLIASGRLGTQTAAHEAGHLFGLCHPMDAPAESQAYGFLMTPDAADTYRGFFHTLDINRLVNNRSSSLSLPGGGASLCGGSKLP